MISHPILAHLIPTGLYCLLEQSICKYYVVRPVGTDRGLVGGFLGLYSFLILGYPHEVIIAVVVSVVHKTVAAHNLAWFIAPENWWMIPGLTETN